MRAHDMGMISRAGCCCADSIATPSQSAEGFHRRQVHGKEQIEGQIDRFVEAVSDNRAELYRPVLTLGKYPMPLPRRHSVLSAQLCHRTADAADRMPITNKKHACSDQTVCVAHGMGAEIVV